MYLFRLDLLQDLSLCQNDELLHESLHLLGRIYAAEEDLFEKATQTQVNLCIFCYVILMFNVRIQQLLITLESESVYTKVQSMLPTLHRYGTINVKEKQCLELVTILEQLTVYVICIFIHSHCVCVTYVRIIVQQDIMNFSAILLLIINLLSYIFSN